MALQELSLKVCISRLPPGTSDDFIKQLLNACGPIKDWKRFMTASGEPKDGGIADFQEIAGVFTCVKFLDGVALKTGNEAAPEMEILAKTNQKTLAYLADVK